MAKLNLDENRKRLDKHLDSFQMRKPAELSMKDLSQKTLHTIWRWVDDKLE